MPRYLIERTFGHVAIEDVAKRAPDVQRITAEQFPALRWVHSHAVLSEVGLKSFCIYDAPDEQAVRDHGRVTGIPVDRVYRIELTDGPDGMTVHAESAAQH